MKFAANAALAFALAATAMPAMAEDKTDAPKAADIVPQAHSTQLSGTFGGQKLRYSATIAETILSADDGTQRAAIVTT